MGKKDVDSLSNADLLARKTQLILRKLNPAKFDAALSSIYSVWLAFAAVLSLQFARAISMALAIATFVRKPMDRFVAPVVNVAIPKEYEQWTPVVMGWVVKVRSIAHVHSRTKVAINCLTFHLFCIVVCSVHCLVDSGTCTCHWGAMERRVLFNLF